MINIGIGLIMISIILIFVSIIKKENSFFNMHKIVKEHFSLFKNCRLQYIVFYGYPLLLAIGISMIYTARSVLYNNLCVIISIILSMLFAVLAIITNFNYDKNKDTSSRIIDVVKETTNAVIFSALLCVFLLILHIYFYKKLMSKITPPS